MSTNSAGGTGPSKKDTNAGSEDSSGAAEALKKLNLQDLLKGMTSGASSSHKEIDMSQHKFWQTQPVPNSNDKDIAFSTGSSSPIDPNTDTTKVQTEPYALIDGFSWVTMDLTQPDQLNDVYTLLYQNYVEDTEAMFRFKYSAPFLTWALRSPGWRPDWHIGIRATSSKKLVAFISGVPAELRIRDQMVKCSEINFMCVHKKLRAKRLAPVLIREITRRCNLVGIWQAIYTGGVLLPTPVSSCRYYHRALDWPKLHEVGFSPMPQNSTRTRQVLRYKLPEKTGVKGLRLMEERDVVAVRELLQRYLDTMEMAQKFSEEEVRHWLLNPEGLKAESGKEQDRVVHSYVIEDEAGKISDFFSFYCIESTVIGNDKHNSIKVAYLFYYASEAAFDESNGKEKKVLKKRLNELIHDALILAKNDGFDVFNALTLLDNPLFLEEQKFGAGDGRLHYYLYNYRTPRIAGGINKSDLPDLSQMGGVGVVML